MSHENVEIVRAAVEAWNRGDLDAALKDAAPDIEFDNTRNLGEWRGVHTTPERVKGVIERFVEPWESFEIEVEELIDAGSLVLSRHTGTFRTRDGLTVTARDNLVWELRDGAIVRVVSYRELEEAREAAGLPRAGL